MRKLDARLTRIEWMEASKMQTIYLVPHTHYDVAGAFSKEEYLKINEGILQGVMELTLRSMKLERFSSSRYCLH